MGDRTDFRSWLKQNTSYCDNVISDIVSRAKRAERLLPLEDDIEYYVFKLSQLDSYKVLSPSVKSHLKKAVKLYCVYKHTVEMVKD